MAKAKLKQKEKATPYSRKNKKPITKSEKIKNAGITEDLDNLMGDLTEHLTAKKKKKIQIKSDTMEDDNKVEEEQRLYEKTQNDMDAALGLLTKL